MKFSFSQPAIGVDFGSRVLKGVQLSKSSKKGVRLDNYFFQDLSELAESGPLTPETLTPKLQALVEVNELKRRRSYSAIPDSSITMFNLQIPKMPLAEVRAAVRNEVENRLTFPIEEATIDYAKPEEFLSGDGTPVMFVRTFCSRREAVSSQVDAMQRANLAPQSVESDLLANIATLEFNGYLTSPSSSLVLVDLGNSHTTVALVKDGKPDFVNCLKRGGNQVTEAIRERFGVGRADAELLKLGKTIGVSIDQEALNQLMHERLYDLMVEIKMSVDYFKEDTRGTIENIVLIGGPSPKEGLAKLFSDYFGLPAEVLDPIRNLEINQSLGDQMSRIAVEAPHLSVAVGLALRGI